MRNLLLLLFTMALAAPSLGETIDAVLQRSQARRLEALREVRVGDTRAVAIQASFQRLLAQPELRPAGPVELRVVEGPVVAECLFGRLIVAHASLAELPEGERLFVLAHELGHAAHEHWAHVARLYRAHVPGEVVREQTDAVAPVLGREMSALSHRHEYDADAFALRALLRLGYDFDTVTASFMRHGLQRDTPTHPATRKRLAQLRAVLGEP